MNEPNPYASPKSHLKAERGNSDGEFVRGSKKGPALYIAVSAIVVTVVLAVALQRFLFEFEPIGFAFPVVGCIAGAAIYRIK